MCCWEVLLCKDAGKALKLRLALMNTGAFKRHFPAVSIGCKFYKLSFRPESAWRDHYVPVEQHPDTQYSLNKGYDD